MAGLPKIMIAMAVPFALSAAAPPNLEYYRCEASATLPAGTVLVSRLVDAQGETVEFRAESRNNDGPDPRYDIFWSSDALDQGKFSVTLGGLVKHKRPVRTIFLECGPNFDSCTAGYRYETGLYPTPGIGAANWAVVLALARTWGKLYVLVEDDRGKIVAHHEIDVARLLEVDATAHRLVAQTAEMARNPKRDCVFEEPWVPIPAVRQKPPSGG